MHENREKRMNAIILAAGLGERLKPITDFVPKPLLFVVSRPIIDIVIARLKNFGVDNIGVNIFHKSEMMMEFLKTFSDTIYGVTEDILRGTGGALLNFREFVGEDFILYNSDIITDIDITETLKFHRAQKAIATLIVTKNPATNTVRIDRDAHIREFTQEDNDSLYTFTGMAVVSKRIFEYLPDRECFSIIEVYKNIIEDDVPLLAHVRTGAWYDIGSSSQYWRVHRDILNRAVKFKELRVNSPCFIDPTSTVETENLSGFVSIGPHCHIAEQVSLNNSVVFGHSRIKKGHYSNCLLSDDFCIEVEGDKD